MSQHITEGQIQKYEGNKLEPAELIAFSDHVAECGECQKKLQETLSDEDVSKLVRKIFH